MRNIEVFEEVWEDLVGKAKVGENVNDVLMRILGIQDAISHKSLEETINEDPGLHRPFIGIQKGILYVHCMESGGRWELEQKNSIDKVKAINEAVDCFLNATYIDDFTGYSELFISNPTDADRKAVSNYIHRMLVEYYSEHK